MLNNLNILQLMVNIVFLLFNDRLTHSTRLNSEFLFQIPIELILESRVIKVEKHLMLD